MRTNKNQLSAFELDIFEGWQPQAGTKELKPPAKAEPVVKGELPDLASDCDLDDPLSLEPAIDIRPSELEGILSGKRKAPAAFVEFINKPQRIAPETVSDMMTASCPICHGRGFDGWGKPCRACNR
jgi:hypothetical protein